MSFIARYFGWLVGPLLFLWLATVGVGEFMVSRAVDAPYDDELAARAKGLADEVRRADAGGNRITIPPGAIRLLRSDTSDKIFYALRDADGQVLLGDPEMPAVPFPMQREGATISNGLIEQDPVRVASLRVPDPEIAGAMLTVQVAETLTKRKKLAATIRAELVAPQGFVLIGAILLVVYGLAYVVGPMERLKDSIDRRDSNDLSALDVDAAPQELRPLITSINELMARLADSLAAQHRFIADAAHQLRTPLAGLKSQTELALAEADPDAVKEALQRLAVGTERATGLANRLLTLARAGTPNAAIRHEVDLVAIAHDAIVEHLDRAMARGQDLGYSGPDVGAVIVGDALLVHELVSNLVDNALRYTADHGTITVEVNYDESRGGTIAVVDTGPGVPADERQKVFEPFYRGNDTVAPGTGLGLAIVRTIADAHQAEVMLEPAADARGLRVSVHFPRISQKSNAASRKSGVSVPA